MSNAVKNDSREWNYYLMMFMTKEYWFKEKRKRKSTVQRFICEWEIDKSNSSKLNLNSWWICVMQNSDIISFFLRCDLRAHVIFESIKDFMSTLKRFEFSNCMRHTFDSLVSIETINKCWLKILFVLNS
jgi:hypothetical protein